MRLSKLPPLVVSEDDSNITDLLVERVAKTPNLPLFALTTENGYQVWRIYDGGVAAQFGSNLAANTISLTDSTVISGHSYSYLIRNYLIDGANTYYSRFCVTATSILNTGFMRFEGIKFN